MEFLKSIPLRLGVLVAILLVPPLFLTNAVLLEVKGLREEVAIYNVGVQSLLGLDLLVSEEPEATPTPTLKTVKIAPAGPTGEVE